MCAYTNGMRPWEIDSDRISWVAPMNDIDSLQTDIPTGWLVAMRAVSHDFGYLQIGRSIDPAEMAWDLELGSDYSIAIGLHRVGIPSTGFLFSNDFTMDASPAQCTVWAAAAVQDFLSGYEYVQWPSVGGRLYVPTVLDDSAVWIDTAADVIVSSIGDLESVSGH